jgi:hypothetical protein
MQQLRDFVVNAKAPKSFLYVSYYLRVVNNLQDFKQLMTDKFIVEFRVM